MTSHEEPKTVKVHYTIQDGEFEYGDSFVMKSPGDNPEETAYQELADFYADDQDERQEILNDLRTKAVP